MNLKSIGISNFKAFGKELQTVPIKPITLVFGPNSAGKSSLIHSLLWLNHATTRGETDVFHPALSGEAVNLGGFEQCLNRKSGEQRLEVSLTMESEATAVESAGWRLSASTFRLVLHFGRVQQGKDPTLERCALYADEQLLLRCWTCYAENSWVEAKVEWTHPSLSGIISQRQFEEHASFAEYRLHCNGMMPCRIELDGDGIGGLLLNAKNESLGVPFSFLAKELPEQFAEIFTGFNSVMEGMQYIPPLREIPKRDMDLRSCQLPGWRWIGKNPSLIKRVNDTLALMGVPHRLDVCELIPTTFLELAIHHLVNPPENGQPTSRDLVSVVHTARKEWDALQRNREDCEKWLGHHPALREKFFEKWYNIVSENPGSFWQVYYDEHPESNGETKPPDWWLREEGWRQSNNDEWLDPRTDENDWATALYISEHPDVREALNDAFVNPNFKKMTASSIKRIELRLRHEQADAWVSLQDVGVGTSQSLPVILEAYGQSNKLIAIEQPELHLHPALQAELGDVFIESALGENKNTFLLETHSEHLILRILRRIRETTEGETGDWPEELRKACPDGIRPEDVAVLYVQPGENGAEVIEMQVTGDGDFASPWPGGFFAERDKELF